MEEKLHVGDNLMMEGPTGKIRYFGHGKFMFKKNELSHKNKLFLVGGGSGITPLLSIAIASIKANDGLDITLIFSNKTKDDILCEKEIDELAKLNPEKFKVFHTLTRHDESKHGKWEGLTGRVNIDMMKQCGLGEPADDLLIFLCGVSAMKKTMIKVLAEHGYETNKMVV